MPDETLVTPAVDLVTIEIDGVTVRAPKGTVLVDAAATVGIEIPIFCYEPRLGAPIGACRMCLVEVEGMRGLQTGCSTVVSPDMVVRTRTPEVKDAQDGVLELLLANHPLDCPVCDKGGECPLQDRTFRFGPGQTRFVEPKRHFPKPLSLSPLVALDRERCIACYRCVRFSQEVAEDGQLTFQERGGAMEVATFTGDPYVGRFTGNIIDLCPVGALTSVPYRFVSRPWEIKNVPSVCTHCAVGCNTELTVREGEIKRVTGRPEPNMDVEEGWLCDRGRWAYGMSRHESRVRESLVRDEIGERHVLIDRAVSAIAARLLTPGVRPAILVGPSATIEEGALAQRLAADVLGGAPVGRLGLPGGGLGPLRAIPGAELGDLDAADVVVVVGGDPANQQPIVELRIRKAHRRGARVLVVGPRPTELDAIAGVERTAPGLVASGLAVVAEAILGAANPVVLWDAADLAAEPDGAADLAGILARQPLARQLELGTEVNGGGLRLLGLDADNVLAALRAGAVDTLITVLADPLSARGANAWADATRDVKTVIEITTHRTALTGRASVVVPTLDGLEREGVVVSMSGRVQRLRPGASGPEGAAPAWEILIALAHRLGAPPAERTPAQVFATVAAATPAFEGLTYERLGVLGVRSGGPGRTPGAVPVGDGDGPLVLVGTIPANGGADAFRSEAFAALRPAAELVLSPEALAAAGLADGVRALVRSPHGRVVLPVRRSAAHPDGGAFVPLGIPGSGIEALFAPDGRRVRVSVEADAA